MITGDHPATASAIARDLGIANDDTVLTGADLAAMDDTALGVAVADCAVFARVAPEHKLRIIDALQAGGDVVAMTGDGVNDAPALRSADIGVAMGLGGTEVAREASSMILADDNFATIVTAVREGRGILDNIKRFLRYLLASNVGEVLAVFFGVIGAGVLGLSGHGEVIAVPILATQILWINLLTDLVPKYRALYGDGAYAPKSYRRRLADTVKPLMEAHGLAKAEEDPGTGSATTRAEARDADGEWREPAGTTGPALVQQPQLALF